VEAAIADKNMGDENIENTSSLPESYLFVEDLFVEFRRWTQICCLFASA